MSVALPNAGTQMFFLEDIKNNRSDMASLLDLRVEKSFRFLEKYKVVLMADLFNALNSNAVTNFNLSNGSRLQFDQRDARSADGDDRRALRVLRLPN